MCLLICQYTCLCAFGYGHPQRLGKGIVSPELGLQAMRAIQSQRLEPNSGPLQGEKATLVTQPSLNFRFISIC